MDDQAFDEAETLAALGEDGVTEMVRRFYQRIPGDELLGPMYPANDLDGAEQRLRNFLLFRLGGSSRYIEERGHPRLRQRHAPFAVDLAARDRWIELMTEAMNETEMPDGIRTGLREFLGEVATFLINRPS